MTTLSRMAPRLAAAAALACLTALATACGPVNGSTGASAAPPASSGPAGRAPAAAAPGTAPPATAPAGTTTPATSGPAGNDTFLAQSQDIAGTSWHEPRCASGCPLSGDGTVILYAMRWSTWTGSEAVGTGTENLEDCVPNCASGGQYRVAVIVTLTHVVKACASGSGPAGTRWYFSRASFSYPNGLPTALQGANAPANPWTFTPLIAQARQSCG